MFGENGRDIRMYIKIRVKDRCKTFWFEKKIV